MPQHLPPLPTFLIIGAQKSGTRWLRFNLGKHPDIYTAPRELEFFNYGRRFQELGTEGYRAQFEGWAGEPHLGEATPGYMIRRHRPGAVAKRIKETVPDARLIALVRDPVDRARSAMVHHVKRGRLPADLSLADFVRRTPPEEEWLGLISGGWYAASLNPYRQLFGDQLLVLLHDDLRDDPSAVYVQALRHIGADPDFVPSDLGDVVFSNRPSTSEPDELPIEARRELYAYFRDDIRKLEQMIDRDLSIWRPEGASAGPLPGEAWRSRFDRTADWVEERIRGVSPEQLDRRVPPSGEAVRDVVDLLVGRLSTFAARLEGEEQQWEAPVEVVRGDPVIAYRAAADTVRTGLVESVTPGKSAGGRNAGAPSSYVASWAVVDQLVHGWDLAVATGQDTTIPDDLAESAYGFVRRLMSGSRVGSEDAVAGAGEGDESASPTERFVALLGRDPGLEVAP